MMRQPPDLQSFLGKNPLSAGERNIAGKVMEGQRITDEEGLFLYKEADLAFLGVLATWVRNQKHGTNTYFNRNFHIEPTNLCLYDCKFCSYSRMLKEKEDGWEMSMEQMLDIVRSYEGKPVTEVHIVGGVHPKMNIHFFGDVLKNIKQIRPEIHIKGFTAVELYYMIRKAKMNFREGLAYLKECGLDSLPGGGAEIFHPEIRMQICADKCNAQEWLEIHQTAHELGMASNCTMLYGHIEKYEHRIDHMRQLRDLQDKTKGFNTFIPLKFRHENNEMAHIPEVSTIEDLRNYAVGRIYFDNIPHVKAYWPMIGRDTTQLSLSFGVNDVDGTIDDSTKIYTMAGSEEQAPAMTTPELIDLISSAGYKPVERDTLYKVLHDYSVEKFNPEAEIIAN